jgi:hypothetical protein
MDTTSPTRLSTSTLLPSQRRCGMVSTCSRNLPPVAALLQRGYECAWNVCQYFMVACTLVLCTGRKNLLWVQSTSKDTIAAIRSSQESVWCCPGTAPDGSQPLGSTDMHRSMHKQED